MSVYLVVVVVVLVALIAWHQIDRRLELERWKLAEAQLRHGVSAKLSDYVYEVLGDLLVIAEQRSLFAGTPASNDRLAEAFARLQRIRRSYHQMRFLDTTGQEVVRVDFDDGRTERIPAKQLQNKAHRLYFSAAMNLAAGEAYISRFDLNMEHGVIEQPHRPMIRLAVPVYDPAGRQRGVLILNYLGEKLLRLLESYSQRGAVRLSLLNADGYWLHSHDPAEAWGFQLPHGRRIGQDRPELLAILAKGEGQIRHADGLFTVSPIAVAGSADKDWLARYTPVSSLHIVTGELPWRLLSTVEAPVLDAGPQRRLQVAILIATAVLLLCLPASLYWGILRARDQVNRERIRQLVAHVETLRDRERAALARDLHDELGGVFTALLFDIDLWKQTRGEADPQLRKRCQDMRAMLERAMESMRRIITDLHPAILDDLGLHAAIDWQLEAFEQRSGIHCSLAVDGDPEQIAIADRDRAAAVFRIFQESLTNILRHADATQVSVELGLAADHCLRLLISDNGRGASADALNRNGAYGILGMKERAAQMGGEVVVDSRPGHGTRILLRMPLADQGDGCIS